MDITKPRSAAQASKPAKDIFEDFIYSNNSLEELLPLTTKYKDNRTFFLSREFIAIYRYIYFVMWKNRIKVASQNSEICMASYKQIAKFSRCSVPTVERAILYGEFYGLIVSLPRKRGQKHRLIVGELIYKLYPQYSSTNEKVASPGGHSK